MAIVDKSSLSERDICTKFITPAVEQAGWDLMTQVREQVYFTKGRVIWRGKTVKRGQAIGPQATLSGRSGALKNRSQPPGKWELFSWRGRTGGTLIREKS